MAVLSIAALKAEIDAWVYENTTHDITGDHMNTILNDIVDSLNASVNVDSWNIIDAAYDASGNPDYPDGDAGDVYVVAVAGKIGGASGLEVNIGDTFFCMVDGTTTGDQVTKGEFWNILQGRLHTDYFSAITGANAPNAGNVFATMADLGPQGATDITWADLLTAIGGSTLTPLAWYHITTAPDGSTTIDEAWVQAKDANEIFPDGMCLVNATNITNRLMNIRFFMAGGVGGKIAAVWDAMKNEIEGYAVTSGGTSSTANIGLWLDFLSAANQSVKVQGSVLTGGTAGNTIGDFTELLGSTIQVMGNSNLYGVVHHGTVTLDNASNANGVYILGGGGLALDNGSIFATGFIGAGKTITLSAGETIVGFSTEGNLAVQRGGANPTGDTVIVDAATGTLIIDDGTTDVTISMPNGVIAGQPMTIIFLVAQSATTWAGATTDANFFPATSAGAYKIEAKWDATNTTWR